MLDFLISATAFIAVVAFAGFCITLLLAPFSIRAIRDTRELDKEIRKSQRLIDSLNRDMAKDAARRERQEKKRDRQLRK